jgi:hypothetical protein
VHKLKAGSLRLFDARLRCMDPENDIGDCAQDNPADEISVLL